MRRGVSIIEVIFAIVIVAIGLLAALTVFPVAAHIARKGRIADESAVAGRAAVHEFDVRGMRDPVNWMAWNPAATPPAYQQYAPVFGESYCIDPRGIAANPMAPVAIAPFPYSATSTQPQMRRLTLNNGFGVPMDRLVADSIFVFDDDHTVERPRDGSLPGYGTFSEGGARNFGGHLSWMATLVPRLELQSTPANPNFPVVVSDYLLSVIVFHDRPADMLAGDPMHERVVHCDFADAGGTGYAGGEAYLSWTAPQNAANDAFARDVQLHLRAGNWIAVGGFVTHEMGGEASSFRWYRVTECDHEPEYHAAEGHYAIAASLAGGDWQVQTPGYPTPIYGTLYGESGAPGTPPIAVLVEGVVTVYEKSIRLSTD